MLLDHGADPSLVGEHGTAADVAREAGHHSILGLVESRPLPSPHEG